MIIEIYVFTSICDIYDIIFFSFFSFTFAYDGSMPVSMNTLHVLITFRESVHMLIKENAGPQEIFAEIWLKFMTKNT